MDAPCIPLPKQGKQSGVIASPFEADCVIGCGYGTHALDIFRRLFFRLPAGGQRETESDSA